MLALGAEHEGDDLGAALPVHTPRALGAPVPVRAHLALRLGALSALPAVEDVRTHFGLLLLFGGRGFGGGKGFCLPFLSCFFHYFGFPFLLVFSFLPLLVFVSGLSVEMDA